MKTRVKIKLTNAWGTKRGVLPVNLKWIFFAIISNFENEKYVNFNFVFFFRNIFFQQNAIKLGDMALKELIECKLAKKLFKSYGSCYIYSSPELLNLDNYGQETDLW